MYDTDVQITIVLLDLQGAGTGTNRSLRNNKKPGAGVR